VALVILQAPAQAKVITVARVAVTQPHLVAAAAVALVLLVRLRLLRLLALAVLEHNLASLGRQRITLAAAAVEGELAQQVD
jgi:hypothetical protein